MSRNTASVNTQNYSCGKIIQTIPIEELPPQYKSLEEYYYEKFVEYDPKILKKYNLAGHMDMGLNPLEEFSVATDFDGYYNNGVTEDQFNREVMENESQLTTNLVPNPKAGETFMRPGETLEYQRNISPKSVVSYATDIPLGNGFVPQSETFYGFEGYFGNGQQEVAVPPKTYSQLGQAMVPTKVAEDPWDQLAERKRKTLQKLAEAKKRRQMRKVRSTSSLATKRNKPKNIQGKAGKNTESRQNPLGFTINVNDNSLDTGATWVSTSQSTYSPTAKRENTPAFGMVTDANNEYLRKCREMRVMQIQAKQQQQQATMRHSQSALALHGGQGNGSEWGDEERGSALPDIHQGSPTAASGMIKPYQNTHVKSRSTAFFGYNHKQKRANFKN